MISSQATPGLDLADSERWIVRNGVGVQIMETLSVGALLVALVVHLGAPNWMIGALAAIPHISQLAQLPALWAVDRATHRRRVYALNGLVARPMLLIIGLAAVALPPEAALWVIFACFSVRYVAGAFLSCSWNSWMRDLIPDNEMGRLFGYRQRRMIGVGIAFSLAAAAFIDAWKRWIIVDVTFAYGIIYALAFIGGLYSVYCVRHIHEPQAVARTEHSAISRIRLPFRQKNYRRLIVFLGAWSFAVNLAAPFFTVYLLKRLEYDILLVMGLATLSQVAAYVTVQNWGLIADRLSNKAVLRTCCPLLILTIFAWTFVTLPEPHLLTLPLLILIHLSSGMAAAGVNLASGNIALKLAPQGDATAYLAASAMVNATAAGLAALAGGILVDLMASWQLSLTVHWQSQSSDLALQAMNFSHWDFFFVFATILGIYALHRLSLVVEDGELTETRTLQILLDSTRQSLRNLSTVAGLRASSNFPLTELLDGERDGEPPHGTHTETPDGKQDEAKNDRSA